MSYEPKLGDKPRDKIEPGKLTQEAVERLARRPGLIEKLEVFYNMWGLDSYDPFSNNACSEAVAQLVKCALIDAAAINQRMKDSGE